MDNKDLVKCCAVDYGSAVADQLQAILDGDNLDEQNSNALRYISKFLSIYSKKYKNEDWQDEADRINDYLKEA